MRRWVPATKAADLIPQIPWRSFITTCQRPLDESASKLNGGSDKQVNELAENDFTATGVANHVDGFDSQESNAGSQLLPLSPLTSPALLAARNRYQAPKPASSGEPSVFQKRLSKNPYAQALATPVRSCSVTGARLPSHFLLGFGLAPHPKTGKPWEMPKLSADVDVVAKRKASQIEGQPENKAESETAQASSCVNTSKAKGKIVRTISASYVSCQISAVGFKSRIAQKSYMQLVPHRWKKDPRIKPSEIVWRKDMDTFVLDLMRRKTTKLLRYLGRMSAAYIVQCSGYEEVKAKNQAAAALWLGKSTIQSPNSIDSFKDKARVDQDDNLPPPLYATMDYKFRQIPVYNLPTLLGSNHLRQLKDDNPAFRSEIAVIKQKHNATALQMELWRLTGYLANSKDTGQDNYPEMPNLASS